jgi:hypothetical protein
MKEKKEPSQEKQSAAPADARLTREEMLYLMRMLDAKQLVVADRRIIEDEMDSFLRNADRKTVEESLAAKRILKRDGRRGYSIRPEIRPMLEALFFPDQALLAERVISGKGRQVFGVLRKNDVIVFHSFPEKKKHFLRAFPDPEKIFRLLVNWAPVSRLPLSQAKSELPHAVYERIRSLAESGGTDEALDLLDNTTLDSGEKNNFLRAFADRKVEGTIVWLKFAEGSVEDSAAASVVSDGRTGWLLSREKPPAPEGIVLNVRRIGADIAAVARMFVERFAGKKLPRREADPSGVFQRFILNADELASALSLINCADLSMKTYAAMSGDVKLGFYAGRMKAAQKSLEEAGLCTASPRGVPILDNDLAQAVFAVAHPDWLIQISASGNGSNARTGVYIARGRFFSAYYNHGELLQVIEYGAHKDVGVYLESLFPGFSSPAGNPGLSSAVSFDAVDKMKNKENDRAEIEKILSADGAEDAQARVLAEDFTASGFRAKLLRINPPPDPKDHPLENRDAEERNGKRTTMLLLWKSPHRNWMVHFPDLGAKGDACVANRDAFRKALTDLCV